MDFVKTFEALYANENDLMSIYVFTYKVQCTIGDLIGVIQDTDLSALMVKY